MKKITTFFVLAFAVANLMMAADRFVFFGEQANSVCFSKLHGEIVVDKNDYKGVHIAVENLKTDLNKVLGRADLPIVVGTVGKSKAIEPFFKKKVLDKKQIEGKREKFLITFSNGKLVIAGSDKRGTIYGVYELSEQLGVSPWYDWADAPVRKQNQVFLKNGVFTDGEPAVRYRGIFLNDEAPCLSGWVDQFYGGVYNHEFYAQVFELVLRLRGNYMWPAMWNSAFYADDPLNMQTADDMGVMMGTSHHEPMAKAHKEWTRDKSHGAWNYDTNKEELDQFWKEGVQRMKHTEDVVTIGMRGNGDEPMGENADVQLLERVVNNQRRLIEEATGKPADKTPQLWALYKEVQEYYEKGMRVPDDVILLLCDDNWGNVRVLPELDGNKAEGAFAKRHPGGYGLYYHVDYVGAPRNSKWLNVSQVQRMWEQLQLTYTYGVDQLWILNVGDLKPMELPIDFWFRMAWNPNQFRPDNLQEYQENFCRQFFGDQFAKEAARLLNLQCKYAHRRTAEQMEARTYNLLNGEWNDRLNEYNQLNEDAKALRSKMPNDMHDAFDQLIGFPVAAMANIYNMYYAHAMNIELEKRGSAQANLWADKVEQFFKKDAELTDDYNKRIAGGKWNHMMDEIHIGYTSWNGPRHNICPKVRRVTADKVNENAENEIVIKKDEDVVILEASDFTEKKDAANAKWQVIPDFGIFKDAVALFPYTVPTDGSALSYGFELKNNRNTPKAFFMMAPTFPFNSGRGQRIEISLDGQIVKTMNINEASRFIVNAFHDQNYEWEKTRINKQVLNLPNLEAGKHTITIKPLDPGVVLERIVIE